MYARFQSKKGEYAKLGPGYAKIGSGYARLGGGTIIRVLYIQKNNDTLAAKYLKQHFKLVILSNVDRASFNHSNKKLGIDFDALYVAGEIYNYKPSKKNFFHMLEHGEADLSLIKGDFIHTAQSLFHDHKPAIEMGFTTCWIDRRGNKGGGITPKLESPIKPHFKFGSMAELVKAVKMELV